MIDYASIAADALVAIKDAGRQIVHRRITVTTDELTGDTTATATTTGTLDCVVLPAKKANALAGFTAGFDNAYAEALRQGKVRSLLCAAASATFEPASGDETEFDGYLWEVLGNTPINPAGVALIYKLEVSQIREVAP